MDVGVPVRFLIRERPGDFVYSDFEKRAMRADMEHFHEHGFNRFVVGALTSNGQVDRSYIRSVRKQFPDAELSFSRAFDQLLDLPEGLKILINEGIDRVLSSGGSKTAMEGRQRLKALNDSALRSNVVIAAAAAIVPETVVHLVKESGVQEVHFSATRNKPSMNRTILTKDGEADVNTLLDTGKMDGICKELELAGLR
jgi:copper homeostasis protein